MTGAGSSTDKGTEALEKELKKELPHEDVRFDTGSRALFVTDASNYRMIPLGVVMPRDPGAVEAAVAACRKHGAPIVCRGGGTALAGQTCNAAVVLDFSRHMNRLLEVNEKSRTARVQPGLILDHLREETQKQGLTFGPDPATHTHCTFGGMIANNSCGIHSVMAGKTDENVHELEVLTYDGARLRVGLTSEDELQKTIDLMRPFLDAGLPIIFCEPSTAAVFRDEAPSLFPEDPYIERMSRQSFIFSEFLEKRSIEPPKWEGKVLFHGHCHQKAVLDPDSARSVLDAMGLDWKEPQEGCCGMAGSFGFEKEHYRVSIKVGEEHLLPAVRKAGPETLLVADGFSCRSQIEEGTGRQAFHLSQLMEMALENAEK